MKWDLALKKKCPIQWFPWNLILHQNRPNMTSLWRHFRPTYRRCEFVLCTQDVKLMHLKCWKCCDDPSISFATTAENGKGGGSKYPPPRQARVKDRNFEMHVLGVVNYLRTWTYHHSIQHKLQVAPRNKLQIYSHLTSLDPKLAESSVRGLYGLNVEV